MFRYVYMYICYMCLAIAVSTSTPKHGGSDSFPSALKIHLVASLIPYYYNSSMLNCMHFENSSLLGLAGQLALCIIIHVFPTDCFLHCIYMYIYTPKSCFCTYTHTCHTPSLHMANNNIYSIYGMHMHIGTVQ